LKGCQMSCSVSNFECAYMTQQQRLSTSNTGSTNQSAAPEKESSRSDEKYVAD
jgi:hypothetical protein